MAVTYILNTKSVNYSGDCVEYKMEFKMVKAQPSMLHLLVLSMRCAGQTYSKTFFFTQKYLLIKVRKVQTELYLIKFWLSETDL